MAEATVDDNGTPVRALSEHEWRHGDPPTLRPEYFPRPVDDRKVIRRQTFALEVETTDEAAYDMELLGHDFFLFTELSTGRDAVVYRRPDGDYGLRGAVAASGDAETVSPIVLEGPAPVMTEEEALARLDVGSEPFVFALDPASGRGRVLYRATTVTMD